MTNLQKGLAAAAGTAVVLWSAAVLNGARAGGPVDFAVHDIDPKLAGAYAVNTADFNKDGRLDVIANSLQSRELAWYENPSWARHVIVADASQVVNQAMADIDGDGIPELVFQSGFAMVPAKSPGLNWIARYPGTPDQPWKTEKFDEFPTSHHIIFADLDGDGRKEVINAPLLGPAGLAPTYDQDKASIFWYSQRDWKRRVVTTDVPGIIHRVRAVRWDGDRDAILVASFEGIGLYRAKGTGDNLSFEKTLLSPGHAEKAPRLGASDVGVGRQSGQRFLAAVEPWHGNEVVVYTGSGTTFKRRVIFDKVASGHEVAVADLNGDGRDDVVANDNSRGPTANNPAAAAGGVHVFFAPDDPATGEWTYKRVEDQSAMNSCVAVDINGDKRIDLVCGGAGGSVKW